MTGYSKMDGKHELDMVKWIEKRLDIKHWIENNDGYDVMDKKQCMDKNGWI